MTDQWKWWKDALAGQPVDSEVGKPRAGFWKAPGNEAVAIWYDDDGNACCERQKFDGSRMKPDQIDELYSSASRYPIEEEVYRAVAERGEPWPSEYCTRLTLKEIQAGIVWSPELGRKKLGSDVKPAISAGCAVHEPGTAGPDDPENPRAVPGHNEPPEPLTPDAKLRAEISQVSATVKAWLAGVGGKPRNKPEADHLADYATRFGQLSKSAVDQHKIEKAPILEQGRVIDATWFGLRDNASLARGRCLTIGQEWMDEENARLAEEARKANEEAAAAAAKAAKQYDAPVSAPPPVEPEKITNIGNMRTVATRERPVWVVTDPKAWAAHLLAQPEIAADLLEVLGKIANRRGAAGVANMPGVTKDMKRSAA